ncbi:MAG: Y-family DNA polymerase [Polaribacter sp.]|nr:Y-family DNA polymerase [Polaribacter sp.]MDG1810362.1 Y-family DNA polymerase [Polaribacter sp.]MDG1994731.1 Y-family DNA polymerase [Polaribacter sp.]
MYALVDCNNFYASCERVFNPNLLGKPVAVLSNNDGCVIAMSDEAKAIQLPFGAPIFKWERFCKANNITVLSSNYPLYGDMSARVMKILSQFSPDTEVYSIDEAFLELKGFENYNLTDYGTQIRSRVLKWTGIPTCVGVAPTKALSKVANKIARKFPKETGGVYVINSEEKRIKAIKWIALENVWGIGRRLHKRLVEKGCKNAFDFTQLSDDWILKNFSIKEWRLKKELQGISKISLESQISSKKSIATTRSFESTISDIENIKERVSTFASHCAEKLRKQQSSCHMIVVFLRSDRFKKDATQHSVSKTIVFPYPTDSTLTISKAAVNAAKLMFKKGIQYKKAGVIITGLVPKDNHQLNLFLQENPKHKPLMSAIDKVNKRFKADKIKLGNQDLKRTWKMRQERLSPKYTTNINDIIVVK